MWRAGSQKHRLHVPVIQRGRQYAGFHGSNRSGLSTHPNHDSWFLSAIRPRPIFSIVMSVTSFMLTEATISICGWYGAVSARRKVHSTTETPEGRGHQLKAAADHAARLCLLNAGNQLFPCDQFPRLFLSFHHQRNWQVVVTWHYASFSFASNLSNSSEVYWSLRDPHKHDVSVLSNNCGLLPPLTVPL